MGKKKDYILFAIIKGQGEKLQSSNETFHFF